MPFLLGYCHFTLTDSRELKSLLDCTYGIETTTGTLKTKRSNDALLLRNLEVCVDTESNLPLWKVHYMRDR